MSKKSEVTNQEILQAINAFSTDVDKRFQDVYERFDGIDNRLDGIDNRLDGIDNRLEGGDKRFNAIEYRLDKLEQGQGEIKLKLDNVVHRGEFLQLQKRVEVLEGK